jgi:hypothetical protein
MADLLHQSDGPLYEDPIPPIKNDDLGLFERLKAMVVALLNSNKKGLDQIDSKLTEEVKNNAQNILSRLSIIKEDLRQNVDDKLFTHVEGVMDPISSRIRSISKHLSTETEQVKAFDFWINTKVKPLVDFFATRSGDREAIVNAVVEHIIESSSNQIETDLKVVKDDQMHKLGNLIVSDTEREAIEKRVEKALTPLILQWNELKKPPQDLTIERLNSWKTEVDSQRSKYYHIAMDIIDSIIPDSDQDNPSSEEMHEQLLINFKQMADLENAIPQIMERIAKGDLLDGEVEHLTERVSNLESEAHQLHQELRLTPELVDRLSVAEKKLQTLRHLLSQDW